MKEIFRAIQLKDVDSLGMTVSNTGLVLNPDGTIHDVDYVSKSKRPFILLKNKLTDLKQLYGLDVIVATAFIPIPDSLKNKNIFVLHKDGYLTNCNVDNLIWREQIEIWKPLVYKGNRYNNYYVSNLGRFKKAIGENVYILKLSYDKIRGLYNNPYKKITLITNGRKTSIQAHRLIAFAFLPGYSEECCVVNHIDNNHSNNNVLNLEWVTTEENNQHSIIIGMQDMRGEKSPKSKMSDAMTIEICKLLNENNGVVDIVFKQIQQTHPEITRAMINNLKYKTTRQHITDQHLTEQGAHIMERHYDEAIIEEISKELVNQNGSVKKVKQILIDKYPWINCAYIWHVRDKSVGASVSDKYFEKDSFPKHRKLTDEEVIRILKTIVKFKNEKNVILMTYDEMKKSIPDLTYDTVRCIYSKRSFARLSKDYF